LYWKAVLYAGTPLYAPFLIKTVDSVLTVWLIMRILNNRSTLAKKYVLENRFFNFIGKISYCLYLIHIYIPLFNPTIRTWVLNTMPHNPLIYIIAGRFFLYFLDLVIVCTIALLSYYLIEQPILRLKKLFKYNSG
jgi:peptidoglycan/LPS O-acetylase OafA/YrhL